MRPPFYFCICPDTWLIQEHIKRTLQASGCGEWTRQAHWGDEPLEKSFWTALIMPGLLGVLGRGRVLILRRAHLLPVKTLNDMATLLRTAKPDLFLFLCLEGEWKTRKPNVPAAMDKQPYYMAARHKGWIWQSPGYTPGTMRARVREWAAQQGIDFKPGVEETLASILPLDGAQLCNELEKLDLLLGRRRTVVDSDLHALGGQTFMDNFAFLKSVLTSSDDLTAWRTVLADHAASGSGMLMPFLGLLQWEVRTMWLLLAGEERKVRLPDGIKQQKKRLASALGEQGLARICDLVFQAEWDLKTGRKGAEQIMESLVAGLSRR